MCKKQMHLFKWGYLINGNENGYENEKIDHIDRAQIDLDLDTNILYIKCVAV